MKMHYAVSWQRWMIRKSESERKRALRVEESESQTQDEHCTTVSPERWSESRDPGGNFLLTEGLCVQVHQKELRI